MILKIISVTVMTLAVFGLEVYTPSRNAYLLSLLIPVLKPSNKYLFEGPSVFLPTTPTTTRLPTLKQMMYYNYYAAASNCAYNVGDLSCIYCKEFKEDVYMLKSLNNANMNTFAFVTLSKTRREIVVSFRGTTNTWNEILDLMLLNKDVSGPLTPTNIKVHLGFYIATMSLYAEVINTVTAFRNQSQYRSYKIIITGHSMGAAMATLTYYFCETLNQFPGATYELFTYGEPRVGNTAFAEYMNSRKIVTARVVARADIVPHLPPAGILIPDLLFDKYVHRQTEFWINGKNDQKFCNQSLFEDSKCSDSMGPAYTVVDHTLYFDVNLATCFANQPLELAALPFGILDPVTDIPPLPEKISNLTGDLADIVYFPLHILLGR